MEYLTRKKKSYRIWILLILFLISAVSFYSIYFVRKSLPPMDGELSLKNLSGSVIVKRDQYGIPHIKAQSTTDAYRALGFVMASERLFQMEMERRMASGALSEVFGLKTLEADKLFRTLGIRSVMVEMIQRKKDKGTFDPQMWKEMEAFYDGVNQFQDTGKLPIEFSILGITPRPFTALDGYSFIGLMSFSFGVATTEEPLLTKLRIRLGSDLTNELRNELTPNESKQIEKEKVVQEKSKRVVENNNPIPQIIAQLEEGFPLFDGSNGWLISAKRSLSGHPILANDPHITYSHPGVWFEAHIQAGDYESYGHFLSILPFPILSHNKERGWGLTMSLIDDMDIYREKLDPKFKSYEFRGKAYAYKERFERITVKKGKPYEMVVIETQHGPVLDEIFKAPEDKSLALKWAFRSIDNDPLSALYKMGKAQSMDEFKAAVALGIAPGLNVLYADKKNIGWWIFGEVAKKSLHTPSDFILDGPSGLDEYSGLLSFDEKPHLENPPGGLIVSANARPVGTPATPDDLRGDWQPDDRYKSLVALLNQKEIWSVEEMMEIQTLNLNLENKLILNELLKEVDFQNIWKKERGNNYLEILKKWDFISDKETIAPTLYYTWCREIVRLLLKDLSKDEFGVFSRLPNSWNFLKRVVLNPDSAWWRKVDRKKTFTDALNNAIESLRQELGEDSSGWAWGHLHTLEFVHPLGKVKALSKIFNIGPVGIGGSAHEINNQKPSGYTDGFRVKAGPSTRRIIDFEKPEKAWGILPTGNSGHIFSPYYKDQLGLFAAGKYREEWLNDKDIEAHKTHQLIFSPAR